MTRATKRVPKRTSPIEPQADAPLLDPALLKVIARLEETARVIVYQMEDPDLGPVCRSLMRAMAFGRLRSAITPAIETLLLELMNTSYGFKTDRGPKQKDPEDREPYPIETVVRCAIAALLEGVNWAGGQWMILDGECFIMAGGWEHRLKLAGVTDITPYPGTPFMHHGQMCVRYGVSWRQEGVRRELRDARGLPGVLFAVKVDNRPGPDLLVGRAHAKALHLVYQIATSTHADVEADGACVHRDVAIDDDQAADLDRAIEEHGADPALIRAHFGLADGERLSADDFAGCMALVRSGKFSGVEAVAA